MNKKFLILTVLVAHPYIPTFSSPDTRVRPNITSLVMAVSQGLSCQVTELLPVVNPQEHQQTRLLQLAQQKTKEAFQAIELNKAHRSISPLVEKIFGGSLFAFSLVPTLFRSTNTWQRSLSAASAVFGYFCLRAGLANQYKQNTLDENYQHALAIEKALTDYFADYEQPIIEHSTDFVLGFASEIGRRDRMEDAHTIKVPFFDEKPNSGFFAIYDGHGGKLIAEHCAQTIHIYFKDAFSKSANIEAALKTAVERVDSDLMTSKLKDTALVSGSTAVIAIIKDNKIYISNTGDSRAVLSRDGKAIALTEDHGPANPKEAARLSALGGHVENVGGILRVGGILTLSRAIGDHGLRKEGVIATPDITTIDLLPEDHFLLLACDGIFESNTITRQDAVSLVTASLAKEKHKRNKAMLAAQALVKEAYKRGSGDNLSALVILLNPTH